MLEGVCIQMQIQSRAHAHKGTDPQIHIYDHARRDTHTIYIYIYIYIYTCMCMNTNMHVYINTITHTSIPFTRTYTHTHTFLYDVCVFHHWPPPLVLPLYPTYISLHPSPQLPFFRRLYCWVVTRLRFFSLSSYVLLSNFVVYTETEEIFSSWDVIF